VVVVVDAHFEFSFQPPCDVKWTQRIN
jgi:hypothetical protein